MSKISQPIQVQASALDHFAAVVRESGANAPAILRSVGLNPCVLDEPEAMIPLEAYRHALALAANETKDDAFGVRLGSVQSFERMGLVGYMVRSAPTIEQMVRDAGTYLGMHNPGVKVALDIDGDTAMVAFYPMHVRQAALAQELGLAQALLTRCMRDALGQDWSARAVYFQEAPPERAQTYRQIFRCPVHFDQVVTATEFPAALLQHPAPERDDRLYRIFRKSLDDMGRSRPDDIVALVRVSVQSMLGSRRPTLEMVAGHLGITPSQLQRRLKEAGVTFQEEVAQVRIALAQRYLEETDEPLSVIADTLGFAEPAVFSRAFRRATGSSPSDWRKQARQRPSG